MTSNPETLHSLDGARARLVVHESGDRSGTNVVLLHGPQDLRQPHPIRSLTRTGDRKCARSQQGMPIW